MSSYFDVKALATGRERYPLAPAVVITFGDRWLCSDESGQVHLSAMLMTEREVDEKFDEVSQDLQRARNEAKNVLRGSRK